MAQPKMDLKDSYQKRYRMRPIGGGITVSVPKALVDRKARELGMTVKEFIRKYCVVMMFNDFGNVDGAFVFEKRRERKI